MDSSSVPSRVQINPVEAQRIRREDAAPKSGGGTAVRADGSGKPVAPPPGSRVELGRVALAVGAVVGLIVLLQWVAKRLFPGVAAARTSQAVQVVTRSVLSPKQQVLVLKVGRRLVVVGDSGAQMHPLAEITDADEIASLIAQLESERRQPTRAFGGLFRKAREPFDAVASNPTAAAAAAALEFSEPQRDDGIEPPDDGAVARPPVSLGLAQAQGELGVLMEKVKELSRQFRKS